MPVTCVAEAGQLEAGPSGRAAQVQGALQRAAAGQFAADLGAAHGEVRHAEERRRRSGIRSTGRPARRSRRRRRARRPPVPSRRSGSRRAGRSAGGRRSGCGAWPRCRSRSSEPPLIRLCLLSKVGVEKSSYSGCTAKPGKPRDRRLGPLPDVADDVAEAAVQVRVDGRRRGPAGQLDVAGRRGAVGLVGQARPGPAGGTTPLRSAGGWAGPPARPSSCRRPSPRAGSLRPASSPAAGSPRPGSAGSSRRRHAGTQNRGCVAWRKLRQAQPSPRPPAFVGVAAVVHEGAELAVAHQERPGPERGDGRRHRWPYSLSQP